MPQRASGLLGETFWNYLSIVKWKLYLELGKAENGLDSAALEQNPIMSFCKHNCCLWIPVKQTISSQLSDKFQRSEQWSNMLTSKKTRNCKVTSLHSLCMLMNGLISRRSNSRPSSMFYATELCPRNNTRYVAQNIQVFINFKFQMNVKWLITLLSGLLIFQLNKVGICSSGIYMRVCLWKNRGKEIIPYAQTWK